MTDTGPLFVSSGDLIADRRYKWALDQAARGDFAAAADILVQTVALAPGFALALSALFFVLICLSLLFPSFSLASSERSR